MKPTRADLITNLVINTDRRTYHLELHSDEKTYMASVSWAYAEDQLIALRQQNAAADAAAPVATGVDINALNFRYRIEGDNPAWRPLRAFDDGRQVFIEFPSGISQGELPPLWVIGAEGDGQLVNYRVKGNHMIVDRLFAAAELKLGGKHQQTRADRPHRWEAAVVTDAPHDDGGGPIRSQPARAGNAAAIEPTSRHPAVAKSAPRPGSRRGDRHRRRSILRAKASTPDNRLRTLQHQQSQHA